MLEFENFENQKLSAKLLTCVLYSENKEKSYEDDILIETEFVFKIFQENNIKLNCEILGTLSNKHDSRKIWIVKLFNKKKGDDDFHSINSIISDRNRNKIKLLFKFSRNKSLLNKQEMASKNNNNNNKVKIVKLTFFERLLESATIKLLVILIFMFMAICMHLFRTTLPIRPII